MRIMIASLVLVATLATSGASPAQTDDLTYCESLYATWVRFISTLSHGQVSGGFDALAAVDQCRKGNTAAGIPVLEKKLTDNRFTLPSR